MKRFYKLFATLFVALLLITGCSTASSSSSEPVPIEIEAYDPLPSSLKAEGFKDYGSMAGKYMKKGIDPEWDCKHYSTCSVLKVYAYRDCPSGVYGEINIVDAYGTVIGWTNDTLGALRKGDYGILVFRGESGGKSARLTELNCR